jgi:Mpv17 / PMP22 family
MACCVCCLLSLSLLSPLHTTLNFQALTAAALSVVSDVMAQKMQNPKGTIDTSSALKQAVIGLLVRGPFVHGWYSILERLFASWPADSLKTAIAKMLVDQTTFSIFFNAFYFLSIGLLNGQSLSKIKSDLSVQLPSVMAANYRVWPLVNVLNFAVVPPNLRYVQNMSFATMLCLMHHFVVFVALETDPSTHHVLLLVCCCCRHCYIMQCVVW